MSGYDAILFVSFGGPEGPDDVMPFLENVLRGRNVPRERMLEVAEHYHHFDGVSPINAQNRELIAALEQALSEHGPDLPIYFGNRNWHPMIGAAIQQMKDDGVKRALAVVTSGFSCYSGCRQYRENIIAACEQIGETAPIIDKMRVWFNHPGFVRPMADRVRDAISNLSAAGQSDPHLIFTAHSIPQGMADNSRYELQLRESSRLVAAELGSNNWTLVYQSRSGPPHQPWLEPDVCDYLESLNQVATEASVKKHVVIIPIGFISDHMEVLFDLDTEAKEVCEKLGIEMARAATVGTHPGFVEGLRQLIEERVSGPENGIEKLALGEFGPSHDVCPQDCCLSGRRSRPPAGAKPNP